LELKWASDLGVCRTLVYVDVPSDAKKL
jgi:hypothetical protein